ncbi:thioesterase II family protein [Burkholderia sp. Ac-20379]|uniref:thioesterase II family protein n=1 Tax=Burkholderia sp. Ac-20379 TaxID=2703900 RepID=UPI00197D989C|nr:alpha/beta fold hydrolase [Burkholderia sp. Ac-20379]MBN3722582.1 thioesterase [Burkholderia sp. Ac-20379]
MSANGVAPASVPPVQLFCLAHAGGAVSLYRRWQQALPHGVELVPLELPGHGTRRTVPPIAQWPALLETMRAELQARRDPERAFALFGHSMGSLIAYELIHALREHGGGTPVWFGASASVAPSLRVRETHWLECTHDQLVARLRSLGGTPEALLRERDFIEMLLPLFRADFHLCGMYPSTFPGPSQRPLLDCPVTVLTGRDDANTADAAKLAGWRDTTRGDCTFHAFAGGHFYLETGPGPVLAQVAESLARAMARPPAPAASTAGA